MLFVDSSCNCKEAMLILERACILVQESCSVTKFGVVVGVDGTLNATMYHRISMKVNIVCNHNAFVMIILTLRSQTGTIVSPTYIIQNRGSQK